MSNYKIVSVDEIEAIAFGSGEIEIDGERHPLGPETMVSIQPGTKRKLWPGPDGLRVVAIGGKAGSPYQPTALSQLGAPDPFVPAA